jgi:hypothetical protein
MKKLSFTEMEVMNGGIITTMCPLLNFENNEL